MSADRLTRILEECRREHHPELSGDLVAEAAEIESRNQFSDQRDAARRELRNLIAQAPSLRPEDHGGAA